MKLQQIISQLSTDEFSQLSIGGQDRGVINEQNYPQVVGHINLALTALYRRFHLKEGMIILNLQPSHLSYQLHSDFAMTNTRSRETLKYIDDRQAAFKDDVLKIIDVKTELGYDLPLNDRNNPVSCFTPTMVSLAVPSVIVHPTNETPEWLRTSSLKIAYRANHPTLKVGLGLFDPERINIELPMSHMEALLYFVASRVNNPIGMNNEFHAGNNYAAKYESVCRELEGLGLEQDQGGYNVRAKQKGFV